MQFAIGDEDIEAPGGIAKTLGLERTMRDAGASMDDIVSLTSYHTDMSHLEAFRGVKDEFIRAPYPAWTMVGVSGFASPEMLVEIAAIAVVGSGRHPTEHRL